jgi:hypothetical protein
MHVISVAQVRLEFDFRREAAVMDTIADNLKVRMRQAAQLLLRASP